MGTVMTLLIVGLGNPGPEYVFHRHNIGFMALDALAYAYKADAYKRKGQSLVTEIAYKGAKVLLCKPLSFMNKSGIPVAEIVSFYKIPLSQILVIHDELDLPFLSLKVKQGGGHGGHNGLKSLDAHVGKEYWRLRVGIGHPGDRERVVGHVLGAFNGQERDYLPNVLSVIIQQISLFFQNDTNGFQQKIAEATKGLQAE